MSVFQIDTMLVETRIFELEQFVDKELTRLENDLTNEDVKFIYGSADFVQKKTLRLEKILRRFFPPEDSESMTKSISKVNDQLETDGNLNSFLRKQKFYIQMIESLEPQCDLSSEEAKLRSKHLDQLYEKFLSNQTEIVAFIQGAFFDKQMKISKEVQQKVLDIQMKLDRITPAKESKVDEYFDRTEDDSPPAPPSRHCGFLLDSKKQKKLIEKVKYQLDVADVKTFVE